VESCHRGLFSSWVCVVLCSILHLFCLFFCCTAAKDLHYYQDGIPLQVWPQDFREPLCPASILSCLLQHGSQEDIIACLRKSNRKVSLSRTSGHVPCCNPDLSFQTLLTLLAGGHHVASCVLAQVQAHSLPRRLNRCSFAPLQSCSVFLLLAGGHHRVPAQVQPQSVPQHRQLPTRTTRQQQSSSRCCCCCCRCRCCSIRR
jgi:hypothetical protein